MERKNRKGYLWSFQGYGRRGRFYLYVVPNKFFLGDTVKEFPSKLKGFVVLSKSFSAPTTNAEMRRLARNLSSGPRAVEFDTEDSHNAQSVPITFVNNLKFR